MQALDDVDLSVQHQDRITFSGVGGPMGKQVAAGLVGVATLQGGTVSKAGAHRQPVRPRRPCRRVVRRVVRQVARRVVRCRTVAKLVQYVTIVEARAWSTLRKGDDGRLRLFVGQHPVTTG